MGFINNYSDNFLSSDTPWGDDNLTFYNLPPQRQETQPERKETQPEMRPGDLGYEQIEDLINQFTQLMPSLNADDAVNIDNKLGALKEEKAKRDNLEEMTREERDDPFEPTNTIVKEDVPIAKAKVEQKPILSTVNLDFEDEILDLELEDLMNQNTMPLQTAGLGGDNTDNFLIASFIVIAVILMTK